MRIMLLESRFEARGWISCDAKWRDPLQALLAQTVQAEHWSFQVANILGCYFAVVEFLPIRRVFSLLVSCLFCRRLSRFIREFSREH